MQSQESIDIEQLAEEIDARLHTLTSSNTEQVRAVRREFSQRIAGASPQEVIMLALRLLDRHRFVAYELVHYHRAALRSLGEHELELLGNGIAGWGAVDTFACYLSGPAWREQQVTDALIERWAHSPDRWWRRAALVSTVPLNLRARRSRRYATHPFDLPSAGRRPRRYGDKGHVLGAARTRHTRPTGSTPLPGRVRGQARAACSTRSAA